MIMIHTQQRLKIFTKEMIVGGQRANLRSIIAIATVVAVIESLKSGVPCSVRPAGKLHTVLLMFGHLPWYPSTYNLSAPGFVNRNPAVPRLGNP